MESIVLAISGLSLVGVSAVLRRTADKHITTVRKVEHFQPKPMSKESDFTYSLEKRTVLKPQVPALLTPDASPVLDR